MTTRLFPKLVLQTFYYKLLFVVLMVGAFLGILRVFYPAYGNAVTVLIALPVLATAGLFGLWGGLLAWVIALVARLLLLSAYGVHISVLFTSEEIFGLGMMLVATVAVGRLYDICQTTKYQLLDCQATEKSLRHCRHLSQQITDAIPDLVYIFDLDEARNVYTNHAVVTTLGYSSDQILQAEPSTISSLIHPDDLSEIEHKRSKWSEALEGAQTIDVDYRMKAADGDWHWLHSLETVFARNPDGSPRQIIGFARDVTSRRQVVQSLVETEKMESALVKERELLQLKNRLMTTISHEFRTPLSIILASGELLERYFDRLTPTRRDECLMTIKTQILHLREMLDEITTIMGEEGFSLAFRPTSLDLRAVFQKAVDEMQASVGSAYTLAFTAEGDLNPVNADEVLLRPILRNLFNNAIKYSPSGEVVEVHLAREGDEVVFTVSDHGIGIPTDEQPRIFDTLHRASNVSHIGGLGIGLRIVRDHVSLHGGTVAVDSLEGQGTTFTVRLPVSPN